MGLRGLWREKRYKAVIRVDSLTTLHLIMQIFKASTRTERLNNLRERLLKNFELIAYVSPIDGSSSISGGPCMSIPYARSRFASSIRENQQSNAQRPARHTNMHHMHLCNLRVARRIDHKVHCSRLRLTIFSTAKPRVGSMSKLQGPR